MQTTAKFQKSFKYIWSFRKLVVPLHPLKRNDRGVEQLVARQAHNLEVACSSPASATTSSRNKLIYQGVTAYPIKRGRT